MEFLHFQDSCGPNNLLHYGPVMHSGFGSASWKHGSYVMPTIMCLTAGQPAAARPSVNQALGVGSGNKGLDIMAGI